MDSTDSAAFISGIIQNASVFRTRIKALAFFLLMIIMRIILIKFGFEEL